MKIAFMFPGQGTQTVGMGKDIYENYEEAREVYERASEIAGIDIAKLCFEGSQEELNKTENTQIAIATTSLAILAVLEKQGITSDVNVGLSLGEYVALINGGILSLEDGIQLLKKRGYYMGNCIPNEQYKMAAVIGMESSVIEEVCKDLQKEGKFVVPANYNYSAQTVISGNSEPVEEAMQILKGKGARKVIELNTSGPFHTKKLEMAKQKFLKDLEEIDFQKASKKIIKNIDGSFYQEKDNIREILANHIISPVRFDKAIQLMGKEGVDLYLEIGPGKTLSGFVKKENKGANVMNIQDKEGIENLMKQLEEKEER